MGKTDPLVHAKAMDFKVSIAFQKKRKKFPRPVFNTMMLILILTLGLHLPMMSTPMILHQSKAWKKFQKKKQVKSHLVTKMPPNQVKKSKKKKNKLARGKSQQQGQFIKESNTDLIFDLDF